MIPARSRRLAALLLVVAGVLAIAAPVGAQPTEADVFVAEGILALEDKQYDVALAHFRRALEREADHVEALYYAGVTYMALSRPADAVAALERAREQSPGERSVAFQLGLAYFAQNQYDRARPLLEELFAAEPTLDSLGYYVGFLRYRRGDAQGALRAFRAGRTADPDIAQLTRFYTGLALAALGLPEQAAAEVEQALRLRPGSALSGPAERLRETFAASHTAESRFRASTRFGLYFDDNATTRPDHKAGDDSVHDLRHGKHESTGESFSLFAEYDWLKRGAWDAAVGYSFLTTYNNELPSLNLIDHLLLFSLRNRTALADMPLYSTAQYSFEFLMFDAKELLQRHSASLNTSLVESARHLTNVQARVDVKEYTEIRPLATAQFQDAVNWMVGGLHLVRFAQDRHFLKAGYQFDIENARGNDYAYMGHRFLAGAQYTLPWWNMRLIYDFGLHYRDYAHRHSVFPDDAPETKERSDHEYSHIARIEMPLPKNFTLSLDYQATNQRSNLAVFTYRRNVYTLSLSWQY